MTYIVAALVGTDGAVITHFRNHVMFNSIVNNNYTTCIVYIQSKEICDLCLNSDRNCI